MFFGEGGVISNLPFKKDHWSERDMRTELKLKRGKGGRGEDDMVRRKELAL